MEWPGVGMVHGRQAAEAAQPRRPGVRRLQGEAPWVLAADPDGSRLRFIDDWE